MALYADTKLAELRAKTDRDLKILLGRALDRCEDLARRADWDEAESVYARSAPLVDVLQGPSSEDASRLRAQLATVRAMLDEASLAA